MNELISIKSKELEGIELSKAEQIKAVFDPMSEALLKFEEEYNKVMEEKESGITDDLTQKAKRLRIDIGKVRISTEKTRKEQKEEYLRAGKAIDGVANIVKWAVTDKENKLKEIEEHFENMERIRIESLQNERAELLSKFVEEMPADLGTMKTDVWEAYLSAKEKQYNDRIEAEKKIEKERVEKERLDKLENERMVSLLPYRQFWTCENYNLREISETNYQAILSDMETAKKFYDKEQEKIRFENERLKKEAEEKERKRKEVEKARKEKEEAERIDREKKERKEREEYEAKLKKELLKRECVEKELAAKKEEERKRKEVEDARIQTELNKGDSDKVKDLISDLILLKTKYSFKSNKNKKMYFDVCELIDKVISHINN